MQSILIPLILQIAFFIVLVLEFIIPSAGVLSAVAVMCLGGSWYFLANLNVPGMVTVAAIADLILIPVTLFVGFKLLQKSPMTNHVTMHDALSNSTSQEWVGRQGLALTMLKPSGKVEIEGRIFEANSSGDYIEPGTLVHVLQISQNRITVEPVSQGEQA